MSGLLSDTLLDGQAGFRMMIGMLAEANPIRSFNDIVKIHHAAAHVRLADAARA